MGKNKHNIGEKADNGGISVESLRAIFEADNDIESQYAVIMLPKSAIEVIIQARIFKDEKWHIVQAIMDPRDIRKAFREAEDNYFPDDAVYTLTEEGRRYADELLLKMREDEDAD